MIGERRDPATVTVSVYHRCLSGAAGSALGPFDDVAYWVIDRGRLVLIGEMIHRHRAEVEDAVWRALGGSPGDQVRAAQDAAADAVD